ncbi:MAG: alanine racemase [Acidobacteria bacterium]|nr:alanine racemase [Acidobacteriota bacterium]
MRRRDLIRSGAGALLGGAVAAAPRPVSATQFFGRGGEPGRRSDAWVGVDAANLTSNFNLVKERAGGRPVMAVVKADAYGHGITTAGQVLSRAGVDAFMVSNTQEAVALRRAELTQPILNFGPMFGGASLLIEHDIEQMVDSREAISGMVAEAAQNRGTIKVQVHIDTGLGRMGIPWQEASELLEYVGSRARLQIMGVSTAFTEDPEYDAVQLQRFNEVCDAAMAAGIELGRRHAASSAAVLSMPDAHLDMVRPGILLYGQYPSAGAREAEPELGLKPVLGLRARVAQVKRLEPGDSVGYHRVYVAPEAETIAVLPIGYSDGYPPEAVARGHVWMGGARCPFVGEMSANHCMVRVPADVSVSPGDFAVMVATGNEPGFFGPPPAEGTDRWLGRPTADMVAEWAGVSVYRALIGFNPEMPRVMEGARRR